MMSDKTTKQTVTIPRDEFLQLRGIAALVKGEVASRELPPDLYADVTYLAVACMESDGGPNDAITRVNDILVPDGYAEQVAQVAAALARHLGGLVHEHPAPPKGPESRATPARSDEAQAVKPRSWFEEGHATYLRWARTTATYAEVQAWNEIAYGLPITSLLKARLPAGVHREDLGGQHRLEYLLGVQEACHGAWAELQRP